MRDNKEIRSISANGSIMDHAFNRIWIMCPACQSQMCFHTRTDSEGMIDYSLRDAPLADLIELTKHAHACKSCGAILKLRVVESPKMEIELVGS